MANTSLCLTVVSPADNQSFELLDVPSEATPAEIITELVNQGQVPLLPAGQSYLLALKGGHQLDETQSLAANGVTDNTTLQLIAPTPGAADDAYRHERLMGNYREMGNIRGPRIDWQGEGGHPPTTYVVTYRLPSYIDQQRTREVHRVRFELDAQHPDEKPSVRMLDSPPVFHPNVFADGRICIGNQWSREEGLGFLVIRVAKMLLYYEIFTNPDHPANGDAARWYRANRARFPLGGAIAFPDPITGAVTEQRRFTIIRRSAQR